MGIEKKAIKEELSVSLIQTQLHWEDPAANRKMLRIKIQALAPTDVIVLPEMFTSGFTMNPEKVAETMTGETMQLIKQLAEEKDAAIVGSLVISEGNSFYNRLLFVHPSGYVEYYDKRHTFTLAGEDKVYAAGNSRLIVSFRGWKICPLICYDLRFPVWARNKNEYDVLLFVANWPRPRVAAWDALLKARAIENMSYVIGVNRVGVDINKHEYSGNSAIYDVLGHQILISEEKEEVLTSILHKEHISFYRQKLKFLNDADCFSLEG